MHKITNATLTKILYYSQLLPLVLVSVHTAEIHHTDPSKHLNYTSTATLSLIKPGLMADLETKQHTCIICIHKETTQLNLWGFFLQSR